MGQLQGAGASTESRTTCCSVDFANILYPGFEWVEKRGIRVWVYIGVHIHRCIFVTRGLKHHLYANTYASIPELLVNLRLCI